MTISEFQKWVEESWHQYRGGLPDKHLQLLYLVEEFGEIAEAIRKNQGNKSHKKTDVDIEEEFGDFFMSLVTIAVEQGVDLEKAAARARRKIIARCESEIA